jgi:preprotein translocase subunit SecE
MRSRHAGRLEEERQERQMASRTTNPFIFLQQVRAESSKVTWPSRRETMISTLMVIAMAFLAAIFFFAADQVMGWAVELILGLGR